MNNKLVQKAFNGPIQSVSRAAAILRCFYDYQELGLNEISKMVGLHKSTTSTLVATLRNEKLLEQDPETSKYRLGMGSFLLGTNTMIGLRTITNPYLSSLMDKFGETVNLAIPHATYIIYITKIESEHSIRIFTQVGQHLPFYCTANGKAIFAYYDSDKLNFIFDQIKIEKYTKNTISDSIALKRELSMVKANGYAVDNEELEEGVCCYAVPIFDCSGTPAAAISMSGPVFRMTGSLKDEMISALKSCATDISGILARSSYMASTQNIY